MHWHWSTGVIGVTGGLVAVPRGSQEPFVVKDNVWKAPTQLGVSKSEECDIFPFML